MIFRNLDGDKSNFTLSDDDEAFQECQSSLTDLSGIRNKEDDANDTIEGEVPSPNSINKTLVLDSNVTFDSDTKKFEEQPVKAADSGCGEERNDTTFNDEKKVEENPEKLNDPEPAAEEIQENLSSKSLQEDAAEAPFEQEVSESLKLNATKTISEHEVSQEALETPLPDTPVSEEADFGNESEYKVEAGDYKTETDAHEPEVIERRDEVGDFKADSGDFRLETTYCADITMEDISKDRQEIASSFPQSIEIPIKDEVVEEPLYRNIDDLGKLNKTHTIPDAKQDTTSAKVFTEELKNSFEVQFKKPAAVFKPSNEPHQPSPPKDEEFGCATSCKTKTTIK